MNRAEIREVIDSNLSHAGIVSADVRVQADPFGGWRIVVVADGFKGKGPSERKNLVLEGLQDLPIEWVDLLTSAEQEWAGDLPLDTDTIFHKLKCISLSQPSSFLLNSYAL